MIRLRKESPEIGWGDWKILETGSACVIAVRYDWRGKSLLTLHNFSDQPQEIRIRPDVEEGETLVNLLANDESQSTGARKGEHRIPLEAHGYRWYRVGASEHILEAPKT